MRLGSIHIECESPPYPIVQASNAIGVERPADVRWLPFMAMTTRNTVEFRKRCSCAGRMPKLSKFRFHYQDGKQIVYGIGQCPKCFTVYWEQA